jgi:excisionase family DNA binding protein
LKKLPSYKATPSGDTPGTPRLADDPQGRLTSYSGALPMSIRELCLVSPSELAALLGVTKRTVWRWISEGRLPEPRRITPSVVRWPADQIENFIQEQHREEKR